MDIQYILLGISLLFLLSIAASKAGYRLGVPALLLFLVVGMLSGSDGLGIQFENIQIANNIGTFALCIILFSGGLDTKVSEIKPVLWQGVLLATIGVLLTALFTGVLIWYILGMTMKSAGIGFLTSLLMASTMSSTDSASVFSILRSKGLRLKNNLRPMLELESGSNDPMAYILVITIIGLLRMESEPNYLLVVGQLLVQLILGALIGYGGGKLAVKAINLLKVDNQSLYPILVLSFCLLIFSFTWLIEGNSYLAAYAAGLAIGNAKFPHKRSSLYFFDGLAWMSQLLMFLTLGLLVNPHELLPVAVPAFIISLAMIFITRPISVVLSLLPFFKMPKKDKVYVSWVGLRGAVPIIFAIIPLAENVPHARLIFNIVFFCTLVSLVVQGTTLSKMAVWLGLQDKDPSLQKPVNFDVDFSEEIRSKIFEIHITSKLLQEGRNLMQMPIPENTLAVLVKRDNKYFVPTGKTPLMENDILLMISDEHDQLLKDFNLRHVKL
jgi:cell volume regulation protein A